MLARPQSSAGFLLIAAISGRALAAAARRAGYRPLVADFFCDTDTVAMAERALKLPGDLKSGIDQARLMETVRQLAGNDPLAAVVLGSGFERKPEIVDELARHFPLVGNRAAAIRRVKNPQSLAEDCAALGIPHPDFRREAPPDPENWVVKASGGAGGTHIRRANGHAPASGHYFQRFVSGSSISALFIGDGRSARVVGFSRQWTSPAPEAPYRYGGAVRLKRIGRRDAELIGGWLSGLAERAGLVGLCSADFIRNADRYQLVEINPRPGATLDIFDSTEAPLIEAHLNASRGEPYQLPRFADSMASMITYASGPVMRFPALAWPDWTADHQSAGTRLAAGDPICTILARGRNAAVTQRIVKARARDLQRYLEES
ncbi:ATP-grasp domain-containing protein [Mesorhizobium sp. BAC0120]|uniref:ATP-grasp domain-containing protein n=1 Tax=Mesorhizobium sp. BAC0120 TaxID=3090670 RepID=UPI00298CE87F|nr:ATP-grasp domain-containing protein [Mesorhizobium sp. BAC0120]MDW6026412.1 ATP-grasp domain-containing protein [Mesorhizobium sp. BAC0120]